MTPEKLHLALNHVTFLLPAAALLPLLVGLLLRSRPALLSGIALALVGGLMTGLVMGSGEEAYERYEDGPVAAYLDNGAEAVLEHHEELAHTWSKVLYALAGVSGVALLIGFLKRAWLPAAALAVVALSLASIAAGLAIADSGGKIRRPDFREGASLKVPREAVHHEHED